MNARPTNPATAPPIRGFLGPEAGQPAGGKAGARAGRFNDRDHQLGDMRAILQTALTQPGVMNQAYRAFNSFTTTASATSCWLRSSYSTRVLPLAPIASFNAWRAKGRFVKKGEKAISLFMPISVKRRADKDAPADSTEAGKGGTFSMFMLRPNWFSLDQTEGDAFTAETITPAWDAVTAMAALDIVEEPFEHRP